jgi:magnesium transporter
MASRDEATRPSGPDAPATDRRLGISSRKVGMAPGSIVYTGERHVENVVVSSMTFTPDDMQEEEHVGLADVAAPPADFQGVRWVNVVGLHDIALITELGERFGLHPLLLEDVVAIGMRPTFIDYEKHAFISLKMLTWSDEGRVQVEHISLVMADNYVMSFQERPGDVFEGVRTRIRGGTTRIRKRDAEYLWYALIDAVVDHYLYVIEKLANRVDHLEDQVWSRDDAADVPEAVQALRSEMIVVRRALRPLRDEVEAIVKEPPEWFSDDIEPFMSDLRTQVLLISDALESMRESLSGVMDAHLSLISMKMNEIMQVLTIMGSIFIPLTFIAGIYGMNFEFMPELSKPWAYPLVWIVMLSVGIGMLSFFRRRGWL